MIADTLELSSGQVELAIRYIKEILPRQTDRWFVDRPGNNAWFEVGTS